MYKYYPEGVCTRQINFRIEDNKVKDVEFISGCPGNLLGISKIVDGMDVNEVIEKFEGTTCGKRSTSCPDQFSKALKHYSK